MADVEQAVIEIQGIIRDIGAVEEQVQKLRSTAGADYGKAMEMLELFRSLGRIRATANDALDILTLPAHWEAETSSDD